MRTALSSRTKVRNGRSVVQSGSKAVGRLSSVRNRSWEIQRSSSTVHSSLAR